MQVLTEEGAWDDLTTSISEARPLVTEFEMLIRTLEQQGRSVRLACAALSMLLLVATVLFLSPIFYGDGVRDSVFPLLIVITFGVVALAMARFRLVNYAENAKIAKRALESELREAEFVVDETYQRKSEYPTSTWGNHAT
ncbi:hypothetical protein [Rugamonas rubra]|uniref:hypothetical protein n=1 Tax=Rugamonas rubra TaxID=758825 RepID=UPI001113ED37|nr:hypothetical protein [Rugamonas rubra]